MSALPGGLTSATDGFGGVVSGGVPGALYVESPAAGVGISTGVGGVTEPIGVGLDFLERDFLAIKESLPRFRFWFRLRFHSLFFKRLVASAQ